MYIYQLHEKFKIHLKNTQNFSKKKSKTAKRTKTEQNKKKLSVMQTSWKHTIAILTTMTAAATMMMADIHQGKNGML